MLLQIDDWVFDVDITHTMERSAAEAAEHCDCAYCRNFYAAVDRFYPNLRPFLAKFGIDIEAPDEQLPYDLDGEMYYDSIYLVAGDILKEGKAPICNDRVVIRPVACNGPFQAVPASHNCPKPCFILDVSTVVLPWILDEPMEETVSPANEPSFLNKMLNRLLSCVKKDKIQS